MPRNNFTLIHAEAMIMDQPNVMMNEPPQKKSGWLKWVLIGCGGLLLIGVAVIAIGVYWVSKNMTMDPAQVETAAQEILQFDKPAGFQGVMSMSMMGVKMAVLGAGEGGPSRAALMLMSIPAGATNTEEMQRQLEQAMKQQGQGTEEITEKRPNETFKIRGEDTVAQVGAGGANHIQYTLTTKGASGSPVLIVLTGSEQLLTRDWVQDFLDTVK
jgi:hypothetical protein